MANNDTECEGVVSQPSARAPVQVYDYSLSEIDDVGVTLEVYARKVVDAKEKGIIIAGRPTVVDLASLRMAATRERITNGMMDEYTVLLDAAMPLQPTVLAEFFFGLRFCFKRGEQTNDDILVRVVNVLCERMPHGSTPVADALEAREGHERRGNYMVKRNQGEFLVSLEDSYPLLYSEVRGRLRREEGREGDGYGWNSPEMGNHARETLQSKMDELEDTVSGLKKTIEHLDRTVEALKRNKNNNN